MGIETSISRVSILLKQYSRQVETVGWENDDERLLERYMYIGEPYAYSSIVR